MQRNYTVICLWLRQSSGSIYVPIEWVMSILETTPPRRCRGHAIGHYIVDFCAPRKKLIIELDGSQHLEQQEYDEERTKYLETRGYRVLRFWNNDVLNNMDAVLKVIWDVLKEEDEK
jgi:very-short-patch-repair endonuclease